MSGRKYIYDVHTKNISFVQTAVDLRKLGIKNNMFFLKLYDRSLVGVDPHSPDLTEEQVMRILNECLINPWYFLRECVRIPDQGNPAGIPYLLNRANLALTWCLINGIDSYTAIPRQIGKTQSTVSIFLWAFLFGTTNSEFMFINMKHEKAIENLSRLRDQRALLPRYLQFKVAYDDEGNIIDATDNVKTLKNASNGNKIVTFGSARSVETAEKIGRGATQSLQFYDEFDFTDYIKTIMEAAGPAFVTASDNAKRNNSMYGRVITSTPGDLDSRAGKDALEILENTIKWSETFYDMNIDDVKEHIATNSGNGIVYIEYQYYQLGKDEIWFAKVCRVINNNPLKIKREIFLMRMHGSQNSPYAPEDLEALNEKKGKIKEEIFINKLFKLDVYTSLNRNKCYFVGVDVANGYGADNSAVTIWDPYELKTVAEFKSANIGVKALIKFLYVLVRKYVPRCILIIERNANGEAVLDHLRDTEIRGNLYFDASKDLVGSNIDDKLDAEGLLKREAARRRLYGVYTQGKSRELMFSLLDVHIREYKDGFVGNNIISDIMKLVTIRGKIQAEAGFHDDSIMSFLMCLYVYYHGNNLHRFGFVRGALPTEEERNKGLNYEDILGYLSENDREYFKNSGYSKYENIASHINIQQQIENRGLISSGELHNDISEGTQKAKSIIDRMSPYELKIYNEMRQAEQESKAFDKSHGLNKSYEMMDDDIDETSYFDMSLFDELND